MNKSNTNDSFTINKEITNLIESKKNKIIDCFRLINICNSIVIDSNKEGNNEISYQVR